MLHILEVFPGWPQPEPVSGLHLILITVLLPLALGVVITAIAFAPKLMQRNRAEAAAVGLGDPVAVDQGPAQPAVSPSSARRAIND